MIDVTALSQKQLLCLADFIAGLERGSRLDPDEEIAKELGEIIAIVLSMGHVERLRYLKLTAAALITSHIPEARK